MSPFFWAVLLLLVGLGLVMLETFVPSGGILGFLSFTAILASIVVAFQQSGPKVGIAFVIVACLAVPIVLVGGISLFASNAHGQAPAPQHSHNRRGNARQRRASPSAGISRPRGTRKSKMLPSGAVVVDGQTIDAVSEGQPIEPNQPVQVIEVRGNLVVVRPVEEGQQPATPTDDVLSRPIETLGIDPLEDPLA